MRWDEIVFLAAHGRAEKMKPEWWPSGREIIVVYNPSKRHLICNLDESRERASWKKNLFIYIELFIFIHIHLLLFSFFFLHIHLTAHVTNMATSATKTSLSL